MRRVEASDIRHLLPHLRRAFMDGIVAYKDQEHNVARSDFTRKSSGQWRNNLILGEVDHRKR